MTAINPSRLDRKHRLTRFAVREHGGNILFMLPAFALFAFVVLIPFLQSIPTSFTDKKAIFAKEWNFVGFENYGKLLKSASFRDSFLHTFQFTIVYIIGANMLGLALALLLWKSGPFNNVMRTLLFMPFTVSLVASTKVWSYVYTDVLSPLTGAPSPLGISSQVIYGLAAIAIWRDMGYCMLIYIAALQSISLEYYEAARVEGANVFHEFIHITLPMIVPSAFLVFILCWINSFKIFKEVYFISGAYPDQSVYTLQNYMNNMFEDLNYQKVTTAAYIFAAIVFLIFGVIYFIQKRLQKRLG